MIFNLLTNPISASKKLFSKINDNMLIGLSIGIPILICLLPAFFIKKSINSILKPVMGMGNILGSHFGNNDTNLSSSIGYSVFKFIFAKLLVITIVITLVILLTLLAYANIKKLKINLKYIWTIMVISAIQIVYYILIAGILSFMSIKLYFIVVIGIINAIICVYSLMLENIEFDTDMNTIVEQEIIDTKEQIAFAAEIGVQVSNNNLSGENIPSSQQKSVTFLEKIRTLDKKQKVGFIGIISVIIIAVALFCVGNVVTSKTHISNKLSQAIKNNDCKKMAKYIVCADSRLKVNEKTISPYAKYLKDNPAYTSKLLSSISSQTSSGRTTSGVPKLVSKGKKYMFFNNYVYELPACFANIQTEYKDTVVTFNKIKLYTANVDNFQKECGPFLPGAYTFQATLKTDYAESKRNSDITFDPENLGNNVRNVELPLDGKKLYVNSEYKDAKIIINGKDTNIIVKDIDKLMPLPTDGSCKVQLQNKFPWGTVTSNEAVFKKDDFQLEFGKGNKALLDTIKPSIIEFVNSYANAYKTIDASKLTNVTERYKTLLTNDISAEKSLNCSYSGSLSSVTVDLDSLKLECSNYNKNDYYTLSVDLSLNGDLSRNGQPYFHYKSYEISFKYDDTSKKWLVYGLDSNWGSDGIKNGTEIKLN